MAHKHALQFQSVHLLVHLKQQSYAMAIRAVTSVRVFRRLLHLLTMKLLQQLKAMTHKISA